MAVNAGKPLVSHRSGTIHNATLRWRTMSEKRVPSSTTCMVTIALPNNTQKNVATVPAWRAVKTTSPNDPCCRRPPVVRN